MAARISVRGAVFAGTFYPEERSALIEYIEKSMSDATVKKGVENAHSYVAPHAGYTYSGGTAAHTYKALSLNKRLKSVNALIIIGPNHTGIGPAISVSGQDWRTPLGDIRNDIGMSESIAKELDSNLDESAHDDEHSVEVQLPFVKYVLPNTGACFICMGDQSLESCRKLSSAIRKSSKRLGRNVLIIASSDMNHYEPAAVAETKDGRLMHEMERLDYKSFNRSVDEVDDSACGYGPVTVAMMLAKSMKAARGVILDYTNSGDVTHDYGSVVAYCSAAFF